MSAHAWFLNLNAFSSGISIYIYIFFLAAERPEKCAENVRRKLGNRVVVRCYKHARRKSRDVFTVTRTRQQAKDEGAEGSEAAASPTHL